MRAATNAARRLGRLAALALLCWLFGAAPVLAQTQQITRATFTPLDHAHHAANDVALPDTWAQRGLSVRGSGRYTLTFTLDARPAQPSAMAFSRISTSRRVSLNGSVIEDTLHIGPRRPVSEVITLPTNLLRAGRNEITIDVAHAFRGGLSPATLGASDELHVAQHRRDALQDDLPRSLNMGLALLGCFLMAIAWRRRGERSMGLFGAFTLLGSVRNYSYFADVALLPRPLGDWLFFCAQVWAAMLFAGFALSLHEPRRHPRLERLLAATAVLLPLAALLATPLEGLTLLRTVVYPVLMVVAVSALVVVWQAMRARRTPTHVALVCGFSAIIAASLHDYAFQQGRLSVTDTFWVPYVMPFALGVYGLLLIERFVRAMNEVERLNVELEQRVQQRTQALQTANAAKTRFLASASHDLRQPVAAIGLMVSLLREQVAAPALRKMIDRVDDALASMENLLKGLLDLSRLEAGTAPARPQPVALQALFDSISVHTSDSARRKRLRLQFRPTPLVAESDPLLLEQVLRNLISNALRYTERGGVLVCARRRGDGIVVQVWDTGIGISPSDQATVYDEFVQLGNPARESVRGFGLGLSIVKRSAAVLGHPLALCSVPGRGSCFSLHMPRARVEQAATEPMAAPERPLAGLQLLLVEDDAPLRDALAERLRAWGAQVRTFGSVPDVLEGLPPPNSSGRFADLLVTDQRLPGGSGLQVIDLVRRHGGPMRALVVTADTAPEDLARLHAAGVQVLHKPFRAEALLAAIVRMMQAPPA